MTISLSLVLRWFLVQAILCGLALPLAADQFGDFTYNSDGSAITISGYTGAGGAVTFPATIVSLPVTAIGSNVFQNKAAITSVVIPNGVASIGNSAFQSCTGLTAITVDAANASFSSLDGVLFNKNLTTLIQYPGGKTGPYTIPASVTSVGSYAFYNCMGLTSAAFLGNAPTMGGSVFTGTAANFTVLFLSGATGFTTPTWQGYPTQMLTDCKWSIDGNGLWSAVANWLGGTVASGTTFSANFSSINISADRTVSLDSPRTINRLTFGDTSPATAGGWILNNNGNSANVLTLAGITPTITVNALGTGKAAAISAALAGSAGLTKSGPGLLTLSGSNTFTGGVTVSTGTLRVGSSALRATTDLTLAGGIFDLNGVRRRK